MTINMMLRTKGHLNIRDTCRYNTARGVRKYHAPRPRYAAVAIEKGLQGNGGIEPRAGLEEEMLSSLLIQLGIQ